MTIIRDVVYRTIPEKGVTCELQFFSDKPEARLVISQTISTGRSDTVTILNGIGSIEELLAAGRSHQADLRYEREAAERKAEREAKAAADVEAFATAPLETEVVQPAMTADYDGYVES